MYCMDLKIRLIFAICVLSQVTRDYQVCLVVRVYPDFLVLPTRLKDSQDNPDFLGDQGFQASQDQKVKLESMDSLAHQDQG